MSIIWTIAMKILENIKIPKYKLKAIVEEADTDNDGYLSLKEIFFFVKERGIALKEKKV